MSEIPLWMAIAGGVLLAVVHVITPSMRFLEGTPRSAWLSIAGGVSVAYVFIHLLPELATGEQHISQAVATVTSSYGGFGFAERHVYLVALLGLVTFYGLERLAKNSRGTAPTTFAGSGSARAAATDTRTSPMVFWIHMLSFGVYNALIGYLLLHLEKQTVPALIFFAIAMALHFVVTDFGLNEDHKEQYRSIGRWILVVAVFAGLAIGAVAALSDIAIAVLVAFLAGGVILNVLKEEVPSERRSRFWAFGLGVAVYTALLLTL